MFVIQDVVQGFHWENSQAMLHPLVVYHKIPINIFESLSICVASDHQSHNQPAIHAFLASTLSFLKTKLSFDFTDGTASQYKNYKVFINHCFHQQEGNLKAEWHFFGNKSWEEPILMELKGLVANAS